MALSEHEKQVLAEIERHLAADDPRFVARTRRGVSAPKFSVAVRRRLAITLAVCGVPGLLMLGVLATPWNLIVAGVALAALFGAVLLGVSVAKKSDTLATHVPPDDRR
jgi:hypothetical protein